MAKHHWYIAISILHEETPEGIQSSMNFLVKDWAGLAFVVADGFVDIDVEVIAVGKNDSVKIVGCAHLIAINDLFPR